jgi:hypothetical protein
VSPDAETDTVIKAFQRKAAPLFSAQRTPKDTRTLAKLVPAYERIRAQKLGIPVEQFRIRSRESLIRETRKNSGRAAAQRGAPEPAEPQQQEGFRLQQARR